MTDEGGRRPKRRCASRSVVGSAMPSATHYVGYVEDEETPEMIMAKFAELERIQQAALEAKKGQEMQLENTEALNNLDRGEADAVNDPNDNQALTDEQLLEVFKQTSMFNVKTALQDNAMLMNVDEMLGYNAERYGYDEDIFSDEEDIFRSFWSDDEDYNDADGDEYGRRKGRQGRGGSRRTGGGSRAQRNAGGVKARHNIVTAYNPDTQALVRRRVRVSDPDEIVQIRVPPPPLPLPWGRTVRAYVPIDLYGVKKDAVPPVPDSDGNSPVFASHYYELESLAGLNLKDMPVSTFQAALINPGWESVGQVDGTDKNTGDGDGSQALAALAKIPLPKLVPTGFVFVWTPKEHVQAVCKLMSKWGYIYVENLTWVYTGANNAVLNRPSKFIGNSHMTLYIFRVADKGRDIELRHQRNPDVTFDCLVAPPPGGKCGSAVAPHETFVAVETLLPTGKGKLLEVWAPKGVRRPGWTHLVEV